MLLAKLDEFDVALVVGRSEAEKGQNGFQHGRHPSLVLAWGRVSGRVLVFGRHTVRVAVRCVPAAVSLDRGDLPGCDLVQFCIAEVCSEFPHGGSSRHSRHLPATRCSAARGRLIAGKPATSLPIVSLVQTLIKERPDRIQKLDQRAATVADNAAAYVRPLGQVARRLDPAAGASESAQRNRLV
jgi:hypothetical protein